MWINDDRFQLHTRYPTYRMIEDFGIEYSIIPGRVMNSRYQRERVRAAIRAGGLDYTRSTTMVSTICNALAELGYLDWTGHFNREYVYAAPGQTTKMHLLHMVVRPVAYGRLEQLFEYLTAQAVMLDIDPPSIYIPQPGPDVKILNCKLPVAMNRTGVRSILKEHGMTPDKERADEAIDRVMGSQSDVPMKFKYTPQWFDLGLTGTGKHLVHEAVTKEK